MKLTLWGMMQYNPDILNIKDIELPEQLDKQLLIDSIVEECGMMNPIHQQPYYLASNINNWFKRRYNDFSKLCEALYADYNPINNYDMTETEKGSDDSTNSNSATSTTSGSALDKVSGFNSPELVNDTDTTTSSSGTSSSSGEGNRSYERTLTRSGNIGVTTTQQMIESSIELAKYDIYTYIITEFMKQFMLLVY